MIICNSTLQECKNSICYPPQTNYISVYKQQNIQKTSMSEWLLYIYHAGVLCFSPDLLGRLPQYLLVVEDEYLYVGANSMSPSFQPSNTPPSSSSFWSWSNSCKAFQSCFLIKCLAKLSSKYSLQFRSPNQNIRLVQSQMPHA